MNTDRIVEIALDLAGMSTLPTDSGIWVPGDEIGRVLFGMDLGVAELDLAQRRGYDLALAHHPPEATIEAWRVYLDHIDQMVDAGVPREEAEAAVMQEIEAMQLGAHARNYDHTVSFARLLGMPFVNLHQPLDEIGRQRLQERVDALQDHNSDATVGDVLRTLMGFPEVDGAAMAPFIAVGAPGAPAGRVVVAHGALDVPNYDMLDAYFRHGVGTVVVLRVSPSNLARLRAEQLGHLIVLGHNAGDSLGFTPFLAALAEEGLEVTAASGVIPG
jgi:hypothetical protein